MDKKELATFRHPSENSRFYLTVFVLLPVAFLLIGIVILTGGVILVSIPVILFFIWFATRLLVAWYLNNTILVSNEVFPEVFSAILDAKSKFGYRGEVDAYVFEDGSYNASIIPLLGRKVLLINSEILAGSDNNEIRFIVGRFVGALAAKHYRFFWLKTFLSVVEKLVVFNLFLYPYERALQYSGDQLGLGLIDGDLKTAIRALTKFVVGSNIAKQVNIQGFLEQGIVSRGSFFAWLARAISQFPHNTHRVGNLFRFGLEKYPDKAVKYINELPESTQAVIRIVAESK